VYLPRSGAISTSKAARSADVRRGRAPARRAERRAPSDAPN
jgi:hypothetical protein